MNPTPLPPSEASQIAQIAAESANQFLQAGITGIALFALIVAFALIIMVIVVIWFLLKRSGSEGAIIKQQAAQNADLIVELREENKNAQASREKQIEATNKQTDSNESVNGTLRMFLEKQSLQEDTLDKMNVNILTVVNGFGAVNEGISRIEKAVKGNPDDHAAVLDALKDIASAQTKIFNLIDSRLPASAKTETPTPLRPNAPTLPPAPSIEALNLKRTTDVFATVKPEDSTPDDPKKAS